MVLCRKHPYNDDEAWKLSCKKSRQLDYGSGMPSVPAITCKEIPRNHFLGHDKEGLSKCLGDKRLESNFIIGLPEADCGRKNHTSDVCSTVGLSRFPNCINSEEHASDTAMCISRSPHIFEVEIPSRMDDCYSLHVEYLPRRLVSIGPDHQAEIPVWDPRKLASMRDDVDKFIGTCVMPMPSVDLESKGEHVGLGRIDCSCPDEGSVRCVRQHNLEARDKLRGRLGQERFAGLGFCEMGEDVACMWSEDEERLFHVVVFSNPSSSGRNFWEHLSVVLPSKTTKELVRYYFNVFVIHRRAEQNRLIPCNVDSDDDWHICEDGDESESTDEDEDSSVESLPYLRAIGCKEGAEFEYQGYDDESGSIGTDVAIDEDMEFKCMAKACTKYTLAISPIITALQEDQEVQDDSCTSYESEHNEDGMNTGRTSSHCEYKSSEATNTFSNGYTHEQYDSRVWDIGVFGCSRKPVEFLPTCNVIKEVFGDEAWTNSSCDNKRTSD